MSDVEQLLPGSAALDSATDHPEVMLPRRLLYLSQRVEHLRLVEGEEIGEIVPGQISLWEENNVASLVGGE